MTYFSYIINVKKFLMKRNNKLNKANAYRLSQEVLRNKALIKGVNLIAPGVKIDYTVNNGAFSSSDFIIINI